MRHAKRFHAAAGLCALMRLIAHAGASQLTATSQGVDRASAQGVAGADPAGEASPAAAISTARCAGSLCGSIAWPYAPEASGAEASGPSRPVRRVRVIALDAAPSSR